MKSAVCIAVIVISACPFFYSQSIGVSAGYGALNMNEVNQNLDLSKEYFLTGNIQSQPETINSGLFLEGNFKYSISNFNAGILVDHIASSGSYGFELPAGLWKENYDVNTTEVMGLIELLLGGDVSPVKLFFQAAGGIGFASASYKLDYAYYQDPSNNIFAEASLSGNYFSGRLKGGLQFIIQRVTLEAAAGYRISDAGVLKGYQKVNDASQYNVPMYNINGNELNFNFSGFMITAGISVRLW